MTAIIDVVSTISDNVATMGAIGVRELKNRLSECLRRVKQGERLVVTERGKPIAVISSMQKPLNRRIESLIREGLVQWGGGKPQGASRPPKIKGRSVADLVIEDRR